MSRLVAVSLNLERQETKHQALRKTSPSSLSCESLVRLVSVEWHIVSCEQVNIFGSICYSHYCLLLFTTEPTPPSRCFTVFSAVSLGAVSSLLLLRAAIVI